MRRLSCGTYGTPERTERVGWNELGLTAPWDRVLEALGPGAYPRTAQVFALRDSRILENRRNVIVSAPTNSGKSLLGLLVLLDAVRVGGRAILLEPLRAIAREKGDELAAVSAQLENALGRRVSVRVSTGDYRLEDEVFSAPPPDGGEILIATPERLEAILRNPKHDGWLQTVRAVCVDEAHLIATARRGPVLEYLITTLISLPAPPRLVLLSATLGNVDRAAAWLAPCDVIHSEERSPPLTMEILAVEEGEQANEAVGEHVKSVLEEPDTSVVVFVYQTRSAEAVARDLDEHLGSLAGPAGALPYHARMSAAGRESVRTAFHEGRSRLVVATSALALGVNLPATHVVIRDTTFAGVGRLGAAELIQMMGRAGRGDRTGHAVAVLRPGEAWSPGELQESLITRRLPEFTSSFDRAARGFGRTSGDLEPIANQIAGLLSRRGEAGATTVELTTFFKRSLGGDVLTGSVEGALAWLTDPFRMLAYRDDAERYQLTALGRKATRATLPLSVAAGVGQLIRDLLVLDPDDRILARWQPLDTLLVLHMLTDRAPALRPFSAAMAEQVDAWMEGNTADIPVLFRDWVAGSSGTSKVLELLGSLGVHTPTESRDEPVWAWKQGYVATFRSIVLFERSKGASCESLRRRWQAKEVEGIEEQWRDAMLWLLAALGRILDVRSFFYHLREECGADPMRIRTVKRHLRRMQRQIFEVQEHLKHCSPLGSLLRSIRSTRALASGSTVGIQSIRRLEDAGIRSVADLARLGVDDLVRLGLRRDLAKQISGYMRRRLQ